MPNQLFSQLYKTVMSPVWLAQLLTSKKSFDNPIIGNDWLNKRGLYVKRVQAAHKLAAWRRRQLVKNISFEDCQSYERDGFVLKENFLPSPLFNSLLEQIKHYRGTVRETQQGDAITRRIALEPRVIAKIPAAKFLLNNLEYRHLIQYISSAATEPIFYIQTILSHAIPNASPDPQLMLHADTFHPTAKAWLFLEDVTEDIGPFTYVPGSHRLTTKRLAWEYQMSLIAAQSSDFLTKRGSFRVMSPELTLPALDLPAPKIFTVKANTLVVADTYGFHARGFSLKPSCRVEIWAYCRRTPFSLCSALDPWRLGNLGQWQAPLIWHGLDLLEKIGIKTNVWRERENTSAFDSI